MSESDEAAGPTSTTAGPAATSAIAHQAVAGAMWGSAASLMARALSLVGTVLIVRFLTPAEYGAIQSAAVAVLTASQFATLGVGPYIVTFPRAGRAVVFHATVIHVSLGAAALALVWACAGRLGITFDAPLLPRFVPGLCLAVFVDRFTFMAERPVIRDLGFRTVSISRTAGDVTFTLVSVALAWGGLGAMAVVWANIARAFVRLGLMLALSNWRQWAQPAPLDRALVRTLFSYGTVVTVESIAEFGSRRWDNLLFARLFGSGVAGNYVLAYNLADLPAIQIGEQIADVLLASYAHVDPKNRAVAVLRAATLMTLIMAPLSIGLGAVGPTVARAFFPAEWTLLGPMLVLLPMMLVMRPIGAVYSAYLMSIRGPRLPMWGEILAVLAMLLLIALFGRHDPLLAIVMVGVAFSVRTLVLMWGVQRTDGVRVGAGLRRFFPIFVACVPMVAAVIGVRRALLAAGIDRPVVSLGLEIAAGGVAYVAAASVLARATVRDLLGLVRGTLQKRRDRRARPADNPTP
jgi:lipopolysaccharide exporter